MRLSFVAVFVALCAATALRAQGPVPVPRVVVLPLVAGPGVNADVVSVVGEAVAGHIARRGAQVTTQAQVKALLENEAQKRLLGCTETACMREIGDALGADVLVSGTLSKLERSYLLSLRKTNVADYTSKLADRRVKNGTIDDVLDALPAMVDDLAFGAPSSAAAVVGARSAPTAATPTPTAPIAAVPVVAAAPAVMPARVLPAFASSDVGSSVAKVPFKLKSAERQRLLALRSARGTRILVDRGSDATVTPVFVGFPDAPQDAFAQRTISSSSEGDTAFSVAFWEPRLAGGKSAEVVLRDGRYTLWCGDDEIPLTVDKRREQRLFAPAWQRRVVALGRDEAFNYAIVDEPREPVAGRADYRLWVGHKGALHSVKLVDAVLEQDAAALLVLQTAEGRFHISIANNAYELGSMYFVAGDGAEVALKWLNLNAHVADVYGPIGVYREPLRTACDEVFALAK